MTDSSATPGPLGGLLTPTSRALAGFALAVSGLLGTNSLSAGLQVLVGPEGGDPGVYGVLLGISVAIPGVLALVLTRELARSADPGWQAHLGRATVVVAALVLLASLMMVVGGFLQF